MTDADVAQRLAYIHRTLELVAFLLAVLLVQSGSIGALAGGGALLLLVVNVVSRTVGWTPAASASD